MFRKIASIIGMVLVLATSLTLPVQAASVNSISGTVVDSVTSAPIKGVTVKFGKLSAVTNGSGNFIISKIPAGSSGKLTPSLNNYKFAPKYITITNIQASLTGQNFTGTVIKPPVYSITGKITYKGKGLKGVTVTYGSLTTTTNSAGKYAFKKLPAGTRGRVTPSKAGYGFTPLNIVIAPLTQTMKGQNFTAIKAFTISGKVFDGSNTGPGLAGVTVSLGSLSAVTNANGAYTIPNVPAGTSDTLTATLTGRTFLPVSITVTNLAADLHAQNFVAQ
jgi:hypothetical protein